MEYRFCVVATFHVYDPKDNTFTTKVHSDVFTNLRDALDSILSYDYPPVKISIHLLTH